jgi:hypothetical protein
MEYGTVPYRYSRDKFPSPWMEDEMRRMAILTGMLGLMALGLAATPAEAHDGWWGYNGWRAQAWREHEWRAQHHFWRPWYSHGYYGPAYYGPGVTFGFDFR